MAEERIHYHQGEGWVRGDQRIPHFKPKYAWVWPNDKPGRGFGGRLKDVLTNKGPDVFLGITGDKRDRFHGAPGRARWSGFKEFTPPWEWEEVVPIRRPWMRPRRNRYDFRKRKYVPDNVFMWTDARWSENPELGPSAIRDYWGNYFYWPS